MRVQIMLVCLAFVLDFKPTIVAVNLAVTLAKECRLKVGLLDADIYGPSIPTMMKIDSKPEVTGGISPYDLMLSLKCTFDYYGERSWVCLCRVID